MSRIFMTRVYALFASIFIVLGGVAHAQDVGTVAAARGVAEIGRAGNWTSAAVGMAVQVGDEMRTGDGQLRVLFQDDSVIDLSANSRLIVDRHEFAPSEGSFTSLMRLAAGRARALVGKYYSNPGASYEIETPTAVAGVRGTSFTIAYDPDTDATEVVGIEGKIMVRGLAERVGDSVYVTAQESTTVLRGNSPTQPKRMDDYRFNNEVEGLELLSLGGAGGLSASRAVGGAADVPAPERAPSSSGLAGQVGRDELRNSGDVAGQPLGVVGEERGSLGF